MDHITYNDYGEKGHYSGNSEYPTQTNIKEDAEAFRDMKQENLRTSPLVGETKNNWLTSKTLFSVS